MNIQKIYIISGKNKHHHLEIVGYLVQSPVYAGHYNVLT